MEGQAAVAWVEEAGSVEGRVVVARRARAEARAVAQGRWKQPLAATRLNGGYTRDNGIYCARAQCASSRNMPLMLVNVPSRCHGVRRRDEVSGGSDPPVSRSPPTVGRANLSGRRWASSLQSALGRKEFSKPIPATPTRDERDLRPPPARARPTRQVSHRQQQSGFASLPTNLSPRESPTPSTRSRLWPHFLRL